MEGQAKGWQGMQGYTFLRNNEGIPNDKRAISVLCANGSRGSVFQTGLPCRQESGGLNTPGY